MPKAIAQITIRDENDITIGATAPSSPVKDELWMDTSKSPSVLKRYTGSIWEVVTEMPKTPKPPSPATKDQIWMDTSTTPPVLKRYNGSIWEVVNDPSGQIDDAINNLQIGGRNLIKNSDFIVEATKTSSAPSKSVNLVDGIDINESLLGKTVTFSYFVNCPGNRVNGNQQGLGSRFGIHGVVQWKNSSTGETKTEYPFADFLGGSYDNKRVSMTYTFTPPGGFDTILMFSFSFQAYARPDIDNNTTWKIGQPKLEIGNKDTSWTPALEDIDSSIQGAQSSADKANSLIYDIANDNKLTATEKQDAKKEWDIIVGEKPKIESNANLYGITTEKTSYINSYNALSTYLNPLLANLSTTSNITGTEFRAKFKTYYDTRQDLLNAIYTKAKKLADDAQSSIDNLEIGGRNLLRNSALEGIEFPYNSTEYNWRTATVSASSTLLRTRELIKDCLAFPQGIYGIKFVNTSTTDAKLDIAQDGRVMEHNETYTLSAYFKVTKGTADYRIQYGTSPYYNKMIVGSSEWVKHSFTFTYDATKFSNSTTTNIYFGIHGNNFEGYACGFRLEKGTKATDWTPAPEDIKSNIGDVQDNLDNLRIGGVNLVTNSANLNKSFVQQSGYTGTSKVIEDSSALCGYRMEFTCTKAGLGFYSDVWRGDDSSIGKTYTWSFLAKMNKEKTLNSIGHESGGTTGIKVTTKWQKFSHTWEYENTSPNKFVFYPNFEVGDILSIKDFKIEEGNKDTTWTPSSNDIYDAIDMKPDKETVYTKTQTDTQIKATADTINSKVSKLEESEVKNRLVTSFRYIRDWLGGNTYNNGNHWVEMKIIAKEVNIAKGLIPTTNGTAPNNMSDYTDEVITTSPYVSIGSGGWYYLQLDLGEDRKDIDMIQVWHYHKDNRAYNHRLEVSRDGIVWYRLFDSSLNGMYSETSDGRTYIINETTTEKRLSTAEQKITSDAIISTVTSTINTAKNDAISSSNSSTDNKLKNYSTTDQMKSAITQSATDVKFSFSQVSDTNGIRNGNFTQDLQFWDEGQWLDVGTSTSRQIGNDTNPYIPSGKLAVVLRATNCTGQYRIDQANIKVTKNKNYTLSFYAAAHRCKNLAARITASDWTGIAELNLPNLQGSGYTAGKDLKNWKHCSITFNSGNYENIRVCLGIWGSENDGYAWFMDVNLCEGEQAKPWSPHPEELVNNSVVINKNGITINNGALTLKNKAGKTVLSGDSNGDLTYSGNIISKSDNNKYSLQMNKGGLSYTAQGETVGGISSSRFESNNYINGITMLNTRDGDYLDFGYTESESFINNQVQFKTILRISKIEHEFMNNFKGIQFLEDTLLQRNKIFTIQSKTDIKEHWHEIYNTVSGALAMFGDNGTLIGYKDGSKRVTVLQIDEVPNGDGNQVYVYKPLSMRGNRISFVSDIYTAKTTGRYFHQGWCGSIEKIAKRISNLNNYMPTGIYSFSSGSAGAPCSYGILIHGAWGSYDNNAVADFAQIVVDFEYTLYLRAWVNGSWKGWRAI